jgi:c-di-GMP-binding flagellar brake protein YcgR
MGMTTLKLGEGVELTDIQNERRAEARTKFKGRLHVSILPENSWVDAELQDISVSGCCVVFKASGKRLNPNEQLTIIPDFLELPSEISIEAVVKWSALKDDNTVAGVKFNQKSISNDIYEKLQDIFSK